jgi:autonomous glycyl radical cofactor GrcA
MTIGTSAATGETQVKVLYESSCESSYLLSGYTIDVSGYTVKISSYTVEVSSYTVKVSGYTVELSGYNR